MAYLQVNERTPEVHYMTKNSYHSQDLTNSKACLRLDERELFQLEEDLQTRIVNEVIAEMAVLGNDFPNS